MFNQEVLLMNTQSAKSIPVGFTIENLLDVPLLFTDAVYTTLADIRSGEAKTIPLETVHQASDERGSVLIHTANEQGLPASTILSISVNSQLSHNIKITIG